MGWLILLIVAAVILTAGALTWATFTVLGLVITLIIAGLVGWAADAVVPGKLPGGIFGAVLAGIVGGWLGHLVFAGLHLPSGPVIADVALLPAFVGAVVIAFGVEIFGRAAAGWHDLLASPDINDCLG